MNALLVFLANAAFFYPIYWLSMFAVHAGPVLLHVAFLGHRLTSLEFSPFWVEAACSPPGAFAMRAGRSEAAALEALLVVAVTAAIVLLLGHHHVLAGLLVASLGQAALTDPLMRVLFGHRHPLTLSATIILYALVLLAGLTMLARAARGGYLRRMAAPVFGFCAPLAIVYSFQVWLGEEWWIIAILVAPALLLAVAAALWNRPPAWPGETTRSATVRRIAQGLAASLLLAGAIHAAGTVRERSQQAARQAFLSTVPKPPANTAYPKLFFQKGVNFTAEGPHGYDPQPAVPMLDQLKNYGVNSIALVPYGFAGIKEPTIGFPGGMERTDDIEALTALAHQRGMKVLLKPQLWTHGGFPGNIDFPAPGERARWFAAYRKFLEYYASFAARIHADVFSVGVELGKMTPYEGEWRALIARARELYPGPLVYSATQGPEFETVRFWDALDYIGLNEYYPLPDDLSTAELVTKVESVQQKFSRPVIFTEAGFSSYDHPNRAPWDETPRAVAPAGQARCYRAVLKAFYSKLWFQGVYWWKVGTDGSGGPEDGSYTPWGKPAMEAVKQWYMQGGR